MKKRASKRLRSSKTDNEVGEKREKVRKVPELYEKFHSGRKMERRGLVAALFAKNLVDSSSKCLYLGSSVHITPSLFFEDVTYVDNWKKAEAFFKDSQNVLRTYLSEVFWF
jgi:hypothetical protein